MDLRLPAAVLAASLLFVAPAAPAAADGLLPHHASYAMNVTGQAGVVLNEGDYIINATTDCKTWNMSSVLTLDFDIGGQNVFVASTLVAQEAYDGSSISYQAATAGPGGAQEVSATGSHDDGAIAVTDAAGTRQVALDDDVLLPTAASLALVERLQDGDTDFTMTFWDAQGAHDATESHIEVLDLEADLEGLPEGEYLDGDVWLIRVTQGSGETASEAIMQIHDGGVISRMQLVIGPVRFEGDLIAFDSFAYQECN